MSPLVSPAELLKVYFDEHCDPAIVPAKSVVGGADDDEQQAGVVSIMDAGQGKVELYAPLISERLQLRCLAPTLYAADRIGNHAAELLDDVKWVEVTDSNDISWFVHTIYCATRPSHHLDSKETFESLFYVNITVGTEPIPA